MIKKFFKTNKFQNIWLAPMAGVSDSSFRIICKKMGANLTFTEMISSKGLQYKNERTQSYLKFSEGEWPVGVQLFGHEPEVIRKSTYEASLSGAALIDINMGCPAPKIVKNQDGCFLMKNPRLIGEIVKSAVYETSVPVSIKIRSGWDKDSINAVEVAKIAENAGISLITVHGRTRNQFYSGNCDFEIIKKVKASVKVPVIANGDIIDEISAKKAFLYTNCDGIMIGRAASGNPWIFGEIEYFFKNNNIKKKPDIFKRCKVISEHLKIIIRNQNQNSIKNFRKHVFWYLKHMKISDHIRKMINEASSKSDFEKIIENILKL